MRAFSWHSGAARRTEEADAATFQGKGVSMLRRSVALVCVCVCALAPAAAARAAASTSWAKPQIKTVIRQGLFRASAATFRPQDPLTRGVLAHAIAKLTATPQTRAIVGPNTPVTMEELDRKLVRALGLGDAAYRFYLGARKAGLHPPKRFGTEAVARILGLRLNHPANEDNLELDPQQTATRAEAAYSLAQIVGFRRSELPSWTQPGDTSQPQQHEWSWHGGGGHHFRFPQATSTSDFASTWEVESAKQDALDFTLPTLNRWQKKIVGTAFSYIGYPYVWGGTGQGTPGFDCSGFVWRVYKLTSYAGEGDLASTLRGRTTYEMSGEVGRPKRVSFKKLQPGDVLFFGKGPSSSPSVVDHTGIYLGNDWFIQSSGYGVAVAKLDGWYRSSFAWARRPLHEAGLE